MKVSNRTVSGVGALLLVLSLLLALPAFGAAKKPCGTKVMYVAAHEDDTLLFQSPDLLLDIKSGRCVRTVFLTAGDAGRPQSYWSSREAGAEAAYAQMAGVADEWTETETVADEHPLTTMTLDEEPAISIVYLRLPDGGTNGKGFPAYGEASLVKLWRGGNPGKGGPTIKTITSVDEVSTYRYAGLIETLEELIEAYEPKQIATQNFNEGLFEGDHPDHTVTGYLTKQAQEGYSKAHRISAYAGYGIASKPENVFGEALGGKAFAFYTYAADDPDACADELSCSSTIYASWLKRQYVTGAKTVGVVADAGDAQETEAGGEVTLNGTGSAAEGEAPLSYEWTQTKGPKVDLEEANTAQPAFIAPSHPTMLAFSLVVSDGSTVSEPDTVTVRVPSDDPTPTAVAGPAQAVDSSGAVTLDGSDSWDPNSLSLDYAWIQTSGPLVDLSGSSTLSPSFVAPIGPATLTFALVVSNGTQASAPATQTVTVHGIAPSFTSEDTVEFRVGEFKAFAVTTFGSPPPAIRLADAMLPSGLSLVDHGDGTATLSGKPTPGAARPNGNQVYPLTLVAENELGTVAKQLTVTVSRGPAPPSPPVPALSPGDGTGQVDGGTKPSVDRAHLQTRRLVLRAGTQARRVVSVIGNDTRTLRCIGRLPRGARCRVSAAAVVIEATRALHRAGIYQLRVDVVGDAGSSPLPLTIRVRPAR